MKNERAVTGQLQPQLDEHLALVAEFMQAHVPAGRLVSVAAALPDLARLLWGRYPADDPRQPAMTLAPAKTAARCP